MPKNPKAKTIDPREELRQRIARNPCIRCSAQGRPICGCGGGGGGSGGSGSEDKESGLELSAQDILDRLADLLTIENDAESGVLRFSTIRPFANLDSEILTAYLDMTKSEFELFKEQLAQEGVDLKDYCMDLKDNCLIIRIPSIKHFDRFIAQLGSKNLLNLEGRAKHENCSIESTGEGSAHYTPFSTRPMPRPKGAVSIEGD